MALESVALMENRYDEILFWQAGQPLIRSRYSVLEMFDMVVGFPFRLPE
jgi:hypothetical protein